MVNYYILILLFIFIDVLLTFYIFFLTEKLNIVDYDNEIGFIANKLFKRFGHKADAYLLCNIIIMGYYSIVYGVLTFLYNDVGYELYLIACGSYITLYMFHINNIKYYTNELKNVKEQRTVMGLDN